MTLRPYQEKAVTEVSIKLAQGKRKVVFQLATGGGKTICFSAISQRYTAKSPQSVLILVHRKELLQQTRKTLFNAFGISPQIIVAGMKHVPPNRIYVGMVESVTRRLKQVKNIGLVIIDEAHIAAFNKIHEHFPTQYIIGFTATPLSASKKHPMKDFYDDIVCGVDIPELIANGSLCQNITFAPRDTVSRASLSIKGGEFDEAKMAAVYSKPQYIRNTLAAYKKRAQGTKTIIFNVNIEHSIKVHNAFIIAGYNSRHLDSTMPDTERTNILKWFANTPDAILNNVGILTAGFDEPTIETVIFNKATKSKPLWLQCTGRASRPTPTKSAFTIIDMGGNAATHGDWCDPVDWERIFFHPRKPKDAEGVAPVKLCPECEAIIAVQCKVCTHCGYQFPTKEQALEEELSEFVVVTRGINVARIMEENKERKEYYPFYKIGKDLAAKAKQTIPKMTDDIAEFILTNYHALAKEWAHSVGKKFIQWHQIRAKEHLYAELAGQFKRWVNPIALPLVQAAPIVPTAQADTPTPPPKKATSQPAQPTFKLPQWEFMATDFFNMK